MKRKLLLRRLKEYGWYFKGHGANHDFWTNGEVYKSIPRHNDINEWLAKNIIQIAKNNPRIYGV
ncbi:MAG: type II toxin-antitoxin system HicA family toxin [Patescibacteria group bacterium]